MLVARIFTFPASVGYLDREHGQRPILVHNQAAIDQS